MSLSSSFEKIQTIAVMQQPVEPADVNRSHNFVTIQRSKDNRLHVERGSGGAEAEVNL